MTAGERFVDTYCIVEDKRRCCLQIPEISKYPHMCKQPDIYVFQPHAKHKEIFNYEGFIPSIKIRYRFTNALRSAGDNVPRLYLLLNEILTEEAIKAFFPKVWLTWYNKMQRRANAAEQQKRNIARKYQSAASRSDHWHITHITTNMSIGEAAKQSRLFT